MSNIDKIKGLLEKDGYEFEILPIVTGDQVYLLGKCATTEPEYVLLVKGAMLPPITRQISKLMLGGLHAS